VVDCTDAGGRAPTVGALGDAGAVAESLSNHERKRFFEVPVSLQVTLTIRRSKKQRIPCATCVIC